MRDEILPAEDAVDDPIGRARRSPAALAVLAAAILLAVAALLALGTWQVHRLSWKLALIARVDERVRAPPVPPPGPADWGDVTAAKDAYRHVELAGTFLNDRETLVQATTELGAGYWVVTPLRTDGGPIVLINRGFVPSDNRAVATRPESEFPGPVKLTGLLRVSEPKGAFLRANAPDADRWYSRDVAAIAAERGLDGPGDRVAPYFVDADATATPGGLPIGGLTVISFPNNHLVYAFTWFALAAMLAAAGAWFARDEWRARRCAQVAPDAAAQSRPSP